MLLLLLDVQLLCLLFQLFSQETPQFRSPVQQGSVRGGSLLETSTQAQHDAPSLSRSPPVPELLAPQHADVLAALTQLLCGGTVVLQLSVPQCDLDGAEG